MPLLKRLRIWFYNYRLKRYHDSLRRGMIKLYHELPDTMSNQDLRQALIYYESNPIAVFPYPFVKRYHDLPIVVNHHDGLPYIEFMGSKKLYFKSHWSETRVIQYARGIFSEQDVESPHLYLANGFDVDPDDTVIDIGVAEGNFSLSVVDKVKQVLIFEYDPGWLHALAKTFQPYQEKVTIYGKKVSDFSDQASVALDDLPELTHKKLFIKIDVDGGERKVLEGMKYILTANPNVRVAICTYHRQGMLLNLKSI